MARGIRVLWTVYWVERDGVTPRQEDTIAVSARQAINNVWWREYQGDDPSIKDCMSVIALPLPCRSLFFPPETPYSHCPVCGAIDCIEHADVACANCDNGVLELVGVES